MTQPRNWWLCLRYHGVRCRSDWHIIVITPPAQTELPMARIRPAGSTSM